MFGRNKSGLWACAALVLLLATARSAADEPIEIFDAHLHYNWEPKPALQLEQVLALFKQHRITGILATSRPNTGTHVLMAAQAVGLQIVPFLRPYRVRADIQTWFDDRSTLDLIREEMPRGYYRGIGEFHIAGKSADTPIVKQIVDFAVDNQLYLHAHADAEAIEIMMRHNPRARIIWAHTGFGLPVERVDTLLAKYPELRGELSYRSGITGGTGRLSAEWRALFEKFPDRFLLGSDTWISERWASYGDIMAQYREWLKQLPPEIAKKIAHANARALFAERS